MPKFSFVIPIYNAETTIDRCLEGILRLDYTDYEIILINDGSTDDSLKYCPRVFQQLEEYERVRATSCRDLHEVSGYSVWNKVYSKGLIEQYSIRFPERRKTGNVDDWSEDLAFNIQYYLHVREIRMLNLDVYFLSKHGSVVEQSEDHLANRIGHMMNVLESVYKSEAIQVSNEYKNMFWQTGVWHIQRYIYLTLRYYGPKELRRIFLHIPRKPLLVSWIESALSEWPIMSQRWESNISAEYHIILRYLLSGKYWKYKMEMAILWKIKNRFKNYEK